MIDPITIRFLFIMGCIVVVAVVAYGRGYSAGSCKFGYWSGSGRPAFLKFIW